MNLPKLILKKNEEKRIKAGHLWIFSNEVDTQASPLKSFKVGDSIEITNHQGKSLGIGYINPNNLLCARLLNRDTSIAIDRSFFVHRFKIALALREQCFAKPFYRLVHAESDGLPGLIVDRFGDHFVLQINTAGMSTHTEAIVEALEKVFKPHSILLRNDGGSRNAEDLPLEVIQAFGETPKQIQIEENNTQFLIDPFNGQKTGWFFDHRSSRKQITQYAKDKKVLDVFSYIGAFGVQAANAGAKEFWSIDISEKALDQLHENASLNGQADKLTSMQGDALTVMQHLKEEDEKFDIIIVDPPAFIKKKKDHKVGLKAYRKVNEMAMRLLSRNGILLSASCSMHLKTDELKELLRAGSRHLEKNLQIIEQCHQGPDHPIHPSIPETEYIKGVISRVTSGR